MKQNSNGKKNLQLPRSIGRYAGAAEKNGVAGGGRCCRQRGSVLLCRRWPLSVFPSLFSAVGFVNGGGVKLGIVKKLDEMIFFFFLG